MRFEKSFCAYVGILATRFPFIATLSGQRSESVACATLPGILFFKEVNHLNGHQGAGPATLRILLYLMDHAFDPQLVHFILQRKSETRVVNAFVQIGGGKGSIGML